MLATKIANRSGGNHGYLSAMPDARSRLTADPIAEESFINSFAKVFEEPLSKARKPAWLAAKPMATRARGHIRKLNFWNPKRGPGVSINSGWAGRLYPLAGEGGFMDKEIKRLLDKETLTPRDVGRLFVAMRVDIHNGREGLPLDQYGRLLKVVNASPKYDEYKLYVMVDGVLKEARDLYEGILREAYLACAGLRMFDEALSFANTTPKKRWDKYALDKMSDATLENGRWLWRNLRNAVKSLAAIKGALRVVGEWLEVPRLESMLPNDKPLRNKVEALNRYAAKIVDKFETEECLKTFDPQEARESAAYLLRDVRDILAPISYDSSQPTEAELYKAREKFRDFDLRLFYRTLEETIDMLNPYDEIPLPGEKE